LADGVSLLPAGERELLAAVGYALFDVPSRGLGSAGQVEIEFESPLDRRPYVAQRAVDVAQHWQIVDPETGWQAAFGPEDAGLWLRRHFQVDDDVSLSRLFRDLLCFSIPASLGLLTSERGWRDRRFSDLLLMDRYPKGLRSVSAVRETMERHWHELTAEARLLEGQDSLFDDFRREHDVAQGRLLEAEEQLSGLSRQLDLAQERAERHAALSLDLDRVREELQAGRRMAAALEVRLERWQAALSLREQAQTRMAEHQQDWTDFQAACGEIARLRAQLAEVEALRGELSAVTSEQVAAQRGEAHLQADHDRIAAAEREAVELAEQVHKQQQLEQQLALAQERSLRLDFIHRQVQENLADAKRLEVLAAEVERQIVDLEALGAQQASLKKLEQALETAFGQLRDASRQVDQIHFLDGAIRVTSGQLDELRRGISATERLSASPLGPGGAVQAAERTLAGHLREALDRHLDALERLVRDWQNESRRLADAAQQVNVLRSNIHQLQQELEAVRKNEFKLGGLPALKQHRKQLREQINQLKQAYDLLLKHQQECADGPARVSNLRQEIAGLGEPRSQRLAALSLVARKETVESEIRQLQRAKQELDDRHTELASRLSVLAEAEASLRASEHKRDETQLGYDAYLTQRGLFEITAEAPDQLLDCQSQIQAQMRLVEEWEARETGLCEAIRELSAAPLEVISLRARSADTEVVVERCKAAYDQAREKLSTAEENRERLEQRRRDVARHERATALLSQARSAVDEGGRKLGELLRSRVAEVGTGYLRALLPESDAKLAWAWDAAPG